MQINVILGTATLFFALLFLVIITIINIKRINKISLMENRNAREILRNLNGKTDKPSK